MPRARNCPRAGGVCVADNTEEVRMTQFRHALIALACIAGTSAASAQTTVITREPAQAQTVVTLTPAQRTIIYRNIVRERAPTTGQAVIEYRVGTPVPPSMQLHAIPDTVVTEVPAIRSYKYMVVNDRVVLVDPVTSQVVEEVVE